MNICMNEAVYSRNQMNEMIEKCIKLGIENYKLKYEIEILRRFGNKDCTAMADEELGREE